MEALMSVIVNGTRHSASKLPAPMYSDHSCYRFLVHEDLRPQELSHIADERDPSPERHWPYSPQLSCSTPRDGSLTPVSTTTSPLSPTSSITSSPSSPLCESGDYTSYIKQEPPSPTTNTTYRHPFSVDSLLGDITDQKGDPSEPAVVFSSTYINNEINRYIMYQSFLTNIYSQSGLSPLTDSSRRCPTQHELKTNVIYWCHVCNAFCVNVEDAMKHKHTHVINRDKCRLKSTIYRDNGCVTSHVRQDDDKIKCGLCDKAVSDCFFSKHQRLHEGHFCEECGKEFSTNSRLQDHKNTHTGKTPYTCTICDRHFAKRSSWTQHERYHRDNRSFMCQFCKKRFNSKYACAVHERLHTGENPFQCAFPGCNRTYPQKIQLKLHMNTHR